MEMIEDPYNGPNLVLSMDATGKVIGRDPLTGKKYDLTKTSLPILPQELVDFLEHLVIEELNTLEREGHWPLRDAIARVCNLHLYDPEHQWVIDKLYEWVLAGKVSGRLKIECESSRHFAVISDLVRFLSQRSVSKNLVSPGLMEALELMDERSDTASAHGTDERPVVANRSHPRKGKRDIPEETIISAARLILERDGTHRHARSGKPNQSELADLILRNSKRYLGKNKAPAKRTIQDVLSEALRTGRLR